MAKESTFREVKGESFCDEKPFLPRISFSEEELPEINSWEIGERYVIELEVEFVELSQENTYTTGEGGERKGEFKVTKVAVGEEEDYTKQVARMMSGDNDTD